MDSCGRKSEMFFRAGNVTRAPDHAVLFHPISSFINSHLYLQMAQLFGIEPVVGIFIPSSAFLTSFYSKLRFFEFDYKDVELPFRVNVHLF